MIQKIDLDEIRKIANILIKRLGGGQWALRGTASLAIQNIDMNVDDIDVICDKETALVVNDLLEEYVVRKVEYGESSKFRSYFGKLNIDGVKIEIMGEWQIKTKDKWSEIFNASGDEINVVNISNLKIPATKVETELKMFSLMGRWTALQKIKRQIN